MNGCCKDEPTAQDSCCQDDTAAGSCCGGGSETVALTASEGVAVHQEA